MIDLMTIGLVIAVALGFRYLSNRQLKKFPNLAEGDADHDPMPETLNIPATTMDEINAANFLTSPTKNTGVFIDK
jgi:hypothetical protein